MGAYLRPHAVSAPGNTPYLRPIAICDAAELGPYGRYLRTCRRDDALIHLWVNKTGIFTYTHCFHAMHTRIITTGNAPRRLVLGRAYPENEISNMYPPPSRPGNQPRLYWVTRNRPHVNAWVASQLSACVAIASVRPEIP